jgi:hypothetical protein
MKRLVAAVAIAILFAVPLQAQAAPFPPRLDFAYDLAINYWGQEPTACSSVEKQIVPRGSLGNPLIGAISGRATQVPPGASPGSISCSIFIDRAYAEPIIFDLLCAVMVHNVGHLLGYEHSPDPSNVMNENIPVPPLCSAKGRESTRVYFLRMRFHRLQVRRGTRVEEIRRQTQRELSREAERFWSLDG